MDINKLLNNIYYKIKNKKLDNLTKVLELVSKDISNEIELEYIKYYTYLYYYYDSPKEEFVNFLKEQNLSPRNNTILIDSFNFINTIKSFLNSNNTIEKFRISLSINYEENTKLINIINSLGSEYIQTYLFDDLDNVKHNIIIIILIYYVYKILDVTRLYEIDIKEELDKAEYIFIETLVHTNEYNLSIVFKQLKLLNLNKSSFTDIKNIILDYIEEHEKLKIVDPMTYVYELIQSDIFIPVVEDFMRYNRLQENYSSSKGETKIQYIIKKVDKMKNRYISNESIDNLLYTPFITKNFITYNEIEEARVVNRLRKYTEVADYALLKDLDEYRKYSFIEYKELTNDYIKICPNNTIQVLRNIQDIMVRIVNESICGNMIGIGYNPSQKRIEKICQKDIKILKSFDELIKIINNDSNIDNVYVWIFDKSYNINKEENIHPLINILRKLLKFIIDKKEEKELIFPKSTIIKSKKEIKLPLFDSENKKIKKNEKDIIFKEGNIVCKHYIDWEEAVINNKVMEFIKHYSISNIKESGKYICKSCNNELDIPKYQFIGTHVEEIDEYYTSTIEISGNIEDIPEYSKHKKSIKIIEKILERISKNLNITDILGNTPIITQMRKIRIKNTLDLMLNHLEWLQLQPENRIDNYEALYGTKKDLSILFGFKLSDNIYISFEEMDYAKILKYNNVVLYVMLNIFLEMNVNQILNFNNKVKYNILLFEKAKDTFMNELFIRIDKVNKIALSYIPQVAYLIFYIAGIVTSKNIWLYNSTMEKSSLYEIQIHTSIIHSFIDLLNTIMAEYSTGNLPFYKVLGEKIYNKIKSFSMVELPKYKNVKSEDYKIYERKIEYDGSLFKEYDYIRPNKDYTNMINDFMNIIKKYLSPDNSNIFISYYKITHDYKGSQLDTPILIPINESNIVLDLLELKTSSIFVYYNNKTLEYIGYSHKSINSMEDIKYSINHYTLIISYSAFDSLKLLGCISRTSCDYQNETLRLIISKIRNILSIIQNTKLYNQLQISYIILSDTFTLTNKNNSFKYILKSFEKLIEINDDKSLVTKIVLMIIIDVTKTLLINFDGRYNKAYEYLLQYSSKVVRNDLINDYMENFGDTIEDMKFDQNDTADFEDEDYKNPDDNDQDVDIEAGVND